MKLYILALLVLLISTAAAAGMTNNQSAYLEGFEDGWHMAYLRFTDIDAFNGEVQKFNDEVNASLNSSEAPAHWLAPAVKLDYTLPEVFR